MSQQCSAGSFTGKSLQWQSKEGTVVTADQLSRKVFRLIEEASSGPTLEHLQASHETELLKAAHAKLKDWTKTLGAWLDDPENALKICPPHTELRLKVWNNHLAKLWSLGDPLEASLTSSRLM